MRFIPFPASILSTKNAHKFCTFLLFAFTKLVSHMSSCFSLSFLHGSDVLQPMLVSYMTSFLRSSVPHIEECIRNFFSSFSSFWMQAGSVRLSRARSRLALLFFFILICALSISYNLFACLFFDSTNSERCFAVLRANTNYNFLIYGNDFTQIQEIRSHCRRRRLF